MTASTPRRNEAPSNILLDSSRFSNSAMGQETHLYLQQRPSCPPCLPSPRAPRLSSILTDDLPAALTLPVLAPRAPAHRRREGGAGGEKSASLMDFVSHLSLSDVAQTLSAGRTSYAPTQTSSQRVLPAPTSTPELEEETAASRKTTTTTECFSGNGHAQWSLTTPETIKTTISTPQAFRLNSQKRKSPLVHSTPVDGNRPLMLPSLSVVNNVPSSNSQYIQIHPGGRSLKKAKNYKNLLSNAPMLPSSPDLEDRTMAAPRYHPPCFSPVGGVTLVNPNYRPPLSTPVSSPPPRRRVIPSATAATLPSLDEADDERSAPKWLRMKKRASLLCALRLAATET